MTVHVNFFCMFNVTGVGRHCENAYFSMLRQRPPGVFLSYVDAMRDSSVRRAIRDSRAESHVTAYFWRMPLEHGHIFPGRSFFWWFFESDHLPQKWLEQTLLFDEIWAPSPWARDVLLAHDVDPDRVRVVESGVNTRIFSPAAQRPERPGFIFLLVGKHEKRKSIDETVAAFIAEFPLARFAQMQLWLKADFPMFPERVKELARRVSSDPRIKVISGVMTDDAMADLYRQADAFVFPTKAEGFGLPCIEAIACGLPVITTEVSAQRTFLDHIPGLFASVDYTVAPIVDVDFTNLYGADYAGEPLGTWAIPSIASLRSAMRDVYENRANWRRKGLQASAVIREQFSWDAIGRKALDGVQALHARTLG
jgi:glycosyltransferase involved in cell wall biosynthesis